jgi:4-hydroxy-2-oxoheptanedioate aldolase
MRVHFRLETPPSRTAKTWRLTLEDPVVLNRSPDRPLARWSQVSHKGGQMTTNRIKQGIAARSRIRGVHMTFPQPAIIEVLALVGLDFVYLDGEHGSFGLSDLEVACITAERHGITPIARIPERGPGTICQFLDRGVAGLVVPHVDGLADAESVVEAAYFAPRGQRSFGGGRPRFVLGIEDQRRHLAQCNAGLSLCIMIESVGALQAAGEIAALPGVDYLSFGLNDLAQALGHAGEPRHPEVVAAVADASQRIRASGKPVREDFMTYAWINEILDVGARTLLGNTP